jgi:hypothetical protein
VRHVGADGDRAAAADDVALEGDQTDRQPDRQRADDETDLLLAHLLGVGEPVTDGEKQRAARRGDEACLH